MEVKPRAIFIGCNPTSWRSKASPFDGTRSGKVLDRWIDELGLVKAESGFMNLSNYESRRQPSKRILKSGFNAAQFEFELLLKCIQVYHGEENGFEILLARLQAAGKLDEKSFVKQPDEKVEAATAKMADTPMPKIITLGEMAAWGMGQTRGQVSFFQLPHPSGLNRKLNDKEWTAKVLADCKAWLYSSPER